MSFIFARGLVAHLIAFAVFLQGLELLQMTKAGHVLKIWSRENLELEMKISLPFPLTWIEAFAKNETLGLLAWTEIVIGAVAFLHPSALAFFILLIAHVLVCIRFRGSINGGSDSMTAMVLIGASIAFLFRKESFACAGLVWIAINLLLSYGRAGLAKFQQSEWKDGTALPFFLGQSFFADVREYGRKLAANPELSKKLGWAVVAAECALVLSPFAASALNAIFCLVVVFHFAVYWAFGLNRFFWVWIAAWPSVFYIAGLIAHAPPA